MHLGVNTLRALFLYFTINIQSWYSVLITKTLFFKVLIKINVPQKLKILTISNWSLLAKIIF